MARRRLTRRGRRSTDQGRLQPHRPPLLEQAIANATAHLGSEEYRRRFEDGRELSVDEAIDLIVRSFATAHTDQTSLRV